MELTVDKATLLPELALLQGVVDRKSTIPILSHLLVEAEGEKVSLTATDLDLTIRTSCPAEVVRAGAATILAKKLFELVRNLPEGPIRLTLLDNNYVQVESARSSFKIIALAAADYPTPPPLETRVEVEFRFGLFQRVVAKVLFAVSPDEGRFQIGGSLIKFRETSCEMISTDGHRLALVEFEAPEGKTFPEPTLIPRKALLELSRFAGEPDDPVVFGISENHISFRVGPRQLYSRALDVRFPDYEKILSKENDLAVVARVDELAAALKRVAIFSSDRSRGVRLDFTEGQLVVSSANPDLGEARETVPVEYEGKSFSIGLNAQYLGDFFGEVESAEVRLTFRDENTHCLAGPAKPLEGIGRYAYVVMPMKL